VIDTNILIYALDVAFPMKKQISDTLIDSLPNICTQNISELANVCLRKFKFDKISTFQIINTLLKKCVLVNCTNSTYLYAENLIGKYRFQLFDAIIVASAIESGCKILHTEDMQHGLIIDKTLTINNSFL
jgi:predicted nucleic acid-binding protein